MYEKLILNVVKNLPFLKNMKCNYIFIYCDFVQFFEHPKNTLLFKNETRHLYEKCCFFARSNRTLDGFMIELFFKFDFMFYPIRLNEKL